MRGGVTSQELFHIYSYEDRVLINDIVKDNIEATKKSGLNFDLKPIHKWDFYKAVVTNDHILTIQTGDTERFTNLILSIGVRMDV